MSNAMNNKNTSNPLPEPKRKKTLRRRESMQTDLVLESILLNGEEVLVNGVIHWGIYWKSAFVFIFALLVCLFVLPIGLILLAAGIIGLIHSYLMQKMLLLTLTNKRVLVRYGILQVDVVDMRFKNIESIELERMLPGFVLGYSNVIVMGIGQRFVRIPYVSNGVTFRRAFNQIVLGDTQEEVRLANESEPEIVAPASTKPPADGTVPPAEY